MTCIGFWENYENSLLLHPMSPTVSVLRQPKFRNDACTGRAGNGCASQLEAGSYYYPSAPDANDLRDGLARRASSACKVTSDDRFLSAAQNAVACTWTLLTKSK